MCKIYKLLFGIDAIMSIIQILNNGEDHQILLVVDSNVHPKIQDGRQPTSWKFENCDLSATI